MTFVTIKIYNYPHAYHWDITDRSIKKAWNSACKLWSASPLPMPHIYRSAVDTTDEKRSAIAYTQSFTNNISVNLYVLKLFGLDLLRPIFSHEIGHVLFCPENMHTYNVIINKVADTLGGGYTDRTLFSVSDLYCNLIVDGRIFGLGEKKISYLYSRAAIHCQEYFDINPLNKIVERIREYTYQIQDPSKKYISIIVRRRCDPEIESTAKNIANTILEVIDACKALPKHSQQIKDLNFMNGASIFARILKPFLPRDWEY